MGSGAVAEADLDFLQLRLGYLREQVALDGADTDSVALFKVLLGLYQLEGGTYRDEAALVLEEARARFPSSVIVLEHLALLYSTSNRRAELDEVLDVLGRLDPSSELLQIIAETTQESTEEWVEAVNRTAAELLKNAGSDDPETAATAITGLRQWARSFPENSTYAVNVSLGLFASGDVEGAREAAYAAAEIEDGSFADAFNIGLVLAHTDARPDGERFLEAALARARTDEEKQFVRDAITALNAR